MAKFSVPSAPVSGRNPPGGGIAKRKGVGKLGPPAMRGPARGRRGVKPLGVTR